MAQEDRRFLLFLLNVLKIAQLAALLTFLARVAANESFLITSPINVYVAAYDAKKDTKISVKRCTTRNCDTTHTEPTKRAPRVI